MGTDADFTLVFDGTNGYRWVKMKPTIMKDGPDCYPWREVFAWWPVKTIDGQSVWLKKIYQRRVWAVEGAGWHMEPIVQYATLFEMLALVEDD